MARTTAPRSPRIPDPLSAGLLSDALGWLHDPADHQRLAPGLALLGIVPNATADAERLMPWERAAVDELAEQEIWGDKVRVLSCSIPHSHVLAASTQQNRIAAVMQEGALRDAFEQLAQEVLRLASPT